MTVTLEFNRNEEKDVFIEYMKEVYNYINLTAESIPASMHVTDKTIEVYFTDDFFSYTYRFFIEQLLMGLSGTSDDRKFLETISKYFRHGAEDMLMSNISLAE